MRIVLVTQPSKSAASETSVREYADDGEALSAIWNLFSGCQRRASPQVLDLQWERSDGTVLRKSELYRWARER